MQRPPRPPKAPILDGVLIGRIVLVGALLLAGAFGLFEYAQRTGHSLAEARTVAVNVFVFGRDVLPVQLPLAHPAVVEDEPADEPLPLRRRGAHAGPAAALHLPARHEPAVRQRPHLLGRPGAGSSARPSPCT